MDIEIRAVMPRIEARFISSTEYRSIRPENFLTCTSLPIKYLGIPLHYEKLYKNDIQPLVDKILKRIAGWSGNLLSYVARPSLINACLASIHIYLLSFLKFPKWEVDLINTHLANCLSNDFEGHSKIYLTNWPLVSMKKKFGGLGIPNIYELNICLLGA